MATNLLPLILLGGGAALLLGSKKKSGSSGGGSANGPKSPNGGNGKPASNANGPKSPNGGNGKPASELFEDKKWNKIRLDRSSAEGERPDGAPDRGLYKWRGPVPSSDFENLGLPIPSGTPVSAIEIGKGADELELVYQILPGGTGYTTSLANLTLLFIGPNFSGRPIPEDAEVLSEVHSQVAKDPVPEGVVGGGGAEASVLFRPSGRSGQALLVVEHTPPAGPKEAAWAILVTTV